MIGGEPQPQALPSTRPRTSAPMPTLSAETPATSTVGAAVGSRDSRVAQRVTTTAITAIGTLMRKIDCQETFSTRKPPTTGPIASATALIPAHVPIALPRSSGGKAFVMIERVAGIMNAAPTPCAARPATSHASVCENAMNRLEAPKTATPTRNQRRRPKTSPIRPPVTSRTANVSVYAFTVHSRFAVEASRSRWIDGSATFTTVLSSITMNSAKHIAPSVHQRRSASSMVGRARAMGCPVRRRVARRGRVRRRGGRSARRRGARAGRR